MDDTGTIRIDGLALPLEQTPFGPCLAAAHDPPLEALRWVVNGALCGNLPELQEALTRGEPVGDGVVTARPLREDDDLEGARRAWQARTGQPLGERPWILSLSWLESGQHLVLPHDVLDGLLQRLQAMRDAAPKPPSPWLFTPQAIHADPHPDEEAVLRQVEPRAGALDDLARQPGGLEHQALVAARRRFLLAELEAYGLLTGEYGLHRARWLAQWRLPALLSYQQAAIAIGEYWASRARHASIGQAPQASSVLGAAISVDWFRACAAPPATEFATHDGLALCERALLDSRIRGDYEGEIFRVQNGQRLRVVWRRDDGVHPSVLRASLF